MNVKSSCFIRLLAVLVFLAVSGTGAVAGNSEEETYKRLQQAKYSRLTGIWQLNLNEEIRIVEKSFKDFLPGLNYTLVDESMPDGERLSMIFRGEGDTKVVVKLRSNGSITKISIRVGLTGSQSKSTQLFGYVYRKM